MARSAARAELWRSFFIQVVRMLNEVERDLKLGADLTLIDIGCLFALAAAGEGGRSMGSLAELWGVDPSVITYRARRLEAKGLVDRRGTPVDHRYVLLRLTAEGRDVLRGARRQLLAAADTHFFDHLRNDDLGHLAQVLEHLQAGRSPGGRQATEAIAP